MLGQKRTLYKREPSGSFLNGAEHGRIVNGKLTIIVKLQDGGEALLSELSVTQIIERRQVERHPHLFATSHQAFSDSLSGESPRETDSFRDALKKLKQRMKTYTIELCWNDRDGIEHCPTLQMTATDYPDVFWQLSSKMGEFSPGFGTTGVQLKIMQQQG